MTTGADAIDPLLDAEPCGFVSFSDDGAVRVVNQTLLDMLGYARAEIVGKHIETILTVGSRIFHQTHFFPLLRLRGSAEEIFLLLRAKGGEDVAVLANAIRRERSGEWITDAVLLRLIERRKFEDALLEAKRAAEEAMANANAHRAEVQSANEQLECQALELELSQEQLLAQTLELERQRSLADDANRAKSSFLAMMSHELRTPLNAIGGYVQLLEMGVHGPVTSAQAEALGRVARSQQHLLRLINDLLNLARIESGRVDYDVQSISLNDVVQSTVPMIEPQLASRALRFEVDVPLGFMAAVDREKVEQILLNLLSNAVKFTMPGGCVNVDAAPAADDDEMVELRVRDTGVGIPANRLEAIFEPFVQVENSKAARVEGSGLGLSISREMARGMGGDISAVSTLGVGSTFTIRLRRG
ncbi:MAG: PAS domain-containing sensor histidine kinase [Gemmatimonadota bacterium]|nr:PAS domain-containing sensor histidine kinase [Gemmatimonadota bacterium]